MFFKEIKDKEVFAIDSAEMVGCVSAVLFDNKSATPKYILLSGGSLLPFEKLFGTKDRLTIRSVSDLVPSGKEEETIFVDLGLPVLDVDGTLYGIVTDIDLHAKYNERDFIMDTGRMKIKSIISSSPNAAFVNPKGRKLEIRTEPLAEEIVSESIDISQKTNKTERDANEIPLSPPSVKIDSPQSAAESRAFEEITLVAQAPAVYSSPEPDKNSNNYNFLIGRKVEKDITDLTRTFVIRAGTIINDRIIESARKAGKLVDLTINSAKRG